MQYQRSFLVLLVVFASCSGEETTGPAQRSGFGNPHRQGGNSSAEAQRVSVRAYRARKEPISTYILSNTTLEAIREVTAYAKLNATVEEILVEEGTAVREGEVLLRLEDREIQNEYLQAQIAVDQAELSLQQAEVRAEQSEASYQRMLSLLEEKLISKQDFDLAALANRTDELAFRVSGEQHEAAKARLEASEIQLGYTEIRSSIDGVIIERLVYVGDRVNVNQAVFTVADLSTLWARIYIPEKELPRIRIGQKAQIQVEIFPDQKSEAVVKMINPAIDPTSGTVKVTLEVSEDNKLLRPGMFGTVYIATETHPDAVVILKSAILRERDENRVFVVKPDRTVEKRQIALGFSDENRVEVLGGVEDGEAVVTVGYEGLNDGYAVNILGWDGGEQTLVTQPDELSSSASIEGKALNITPVRGEQARGRRGGPDFGLRPRGQQDFDPERLKMLEDRLLRMPEIRKEYESRLAEDPTLSTDPKKRTAFFREMMRTVGQAREGP